MRLGPDSLAVLSQQRLDASQVPKGRYVLTSMESCTFLILDTHDPRSSLKKKRGLLTQGQLLYPLPRGHLCLDSSLSSTYCKCPYCQGFDYLPEGLRTSVRTTNSLNYSTISPNQENEVLNSHISRRDFWQTSQSVLV